jgi:hypothetical protein
MVPLKRFTNEWCTEDPRMWRTKGPYIAPRPALKASNFINIKQCVHVETTKFCDMTPYSLADGHLPTSLHGVAPQKATIVIAPWALQIPVRPRRITSNFLCYSNVSTCWTIKKEYHQQNQNKQKEMQHTITVRYCGMTKKYMSLAGS